MDAGRGDNNGYYDKYQLNRTYLGSKHWREKDLSPGHRGDTGTLPG